MAFIMSSRKQLLTDTDVNSLTYESIVALKHNIVVLYLLEHCSKLTHCCTLIVCQVMSEPDVTSIMVTSSYTQTVD